MSETELVVDSEVGTDEESKFVRLLNRCVKKVKEMKHVDSKYALENMIFPLFASFYREFDDEIENVHQKIDVDDDLAEAIADSPEFIQDLVKYVSWVGTSVDTIYRLAGFIVVDENDKSQANFTSRATDEVKKLYTEIGKQNIGMLSKIKEVEEMLPDDDESDDDDEPDDGQGDDDGSVALNQIVDPVVDAPKEVVHQVPMTAGPDAEVNEITTTPQVKA